MLEHKGHDGQNPVGNQEESPSHRAMQGQTPDMESRRKSFTPTIKDKT